MSAADVYSDPRNALALARRCFGEWRRLWSDIAYAREMIHPG